MITAAPSQSWVWWGDSITAVYKWFTGAQTAIINFYTALFGAGDPRIPTFFNGGINGGTTTDCNTNFNTIFTANNPDVCVGLIGINDLTSPIDLYIATLTDIMSKVRTQRPKCQFGVCSIMMAGEFWQGAYPPNFGDPFVDSKRGAVEALALRFGATFIDFRSLFWQSEPLYNPTNLQQGALGVDGIHPTPTMTGLMSNLALSQITMSSTTYTPTGYVTQPNPPWVYDTRWLP